VVGQVTVLYLLGAARRGLLASGRAEQLSKDRALLPASYLGGPAAGAAG
jgi:hypothetical protein